MTKWKRVRKKEWSGLADPEVVDLCDALNEIPTLKTLESCCGHDTEPMLIWFTIEDYRWLFVVGRCIDKRYLSCQFECKLSIGDVPERAVAFLLESKKVGHLAYAEANRMADGIRKYLQRKSVLEHFGLEVVA